MRQKTRLGRRAKRTVEGDHTAVDPADTARQIALFETGIGWQHGLIDILIALIAALLLLPLRSFLRSGSRDRR